MAVDSGEVARVAGAASHSQKTPIPPQNSPISPQMSLVSPQKSPTFPQKSPVSPKNSPTSPQKSHYCEMVWLASGPICLFITLFLSLFLVLDLSVSQSLFRLFSPDVVSGSVSGSCIYIYIYI